ncbi:FAD-dependent monooxygenase [Photobacterium leiognathi]|uniref:FAD-dependent monooxygenase n=1 Tax=Photobacterium leiognathi TaxID=553611 RepID=UPI0027397F46|nr:FAD-dependent monooxygenase [Photobacterium leiognathi]
MIPLNNTPIAIIGAGPVGMALAALLSEHKIKTEVFDKEPHLQRKGSKACLIQGDVLEILARIGCAAPIAKEGIHWRIAHTYLKDIELITQDFPERLGFGPFVNISQYRIEQVLEEYLKQSPYCNLHWQHQVEGMSIQKASVTLHFTHSEGKHTERFQYVVACDGVRSTLRELAGQEFSGYTHQNRFLITDIRAQIPLTKERHFWFDPSFHPGKQLVMHPQPDNIWRIDWQLEEGADIEAEKNNGKLDQRIKKVIGDIPYNIEWISTYRFNQKVIERFRIGNLFFAGDAAHSLPPYGSRGMNSGIQDADNLAWKFARVLSGRAGDELLDTYHSERRDAALENLRLTEATMKFIAPEQWRVKFKRDMILKLSRLFPGAKKFIDHGKMAEPFTYAASDLIDSYEGSCTLSGRFIPDLKVFVNNKPSRLREQLSMEFSVIFFVDNNQLENTLTQYAEMISNQQINILVALPITGQPIKKIQGVSIISYDDMFAAQQFRKQTATYLIVRPDGHVAGHYNITEHSRGFGLLERYQLLNRVSETTLGTAIKEGAVV